MKWSEGRAFPSRDVLGRFRGGLRAGSHNLSVLWHLETLLALTLPGCDFPIFSPLSFNRPFLALLMAEACEETPAEWQHPLRQACSGGCLLATGVPNTVPC